MSLPDVIESDGVMRCKCGATAAPKDRGRFLKRHPKLCSQRKEFNKKLASGTRSVGTSQTEDVDLYRLEVIESTGRNFTEWEQKFIKDIRVKIGMVGTSLLTENQKLHIKKVYDERTPN